MNPYKFPYPPPGRNCSLIKGCQNVPLPTERGCLEHAILYRRQVAAISAGVGWMLRMWVPGFESLDTFNAFQLDKISPTLPDINWDDISTLIGVAFAIAFLASLENTVMAKSLASRSGRGTPCSCP